MDLYNYKINYNITETILSNIHKYKNKIKYFLFNNKKSKKIKL